jgi:hypothetical protein
MTATSAHPTSRPPAQAPPLPNLVLAAAAAGVIGAWNVLTGLAAVTEDDTTEALGEVLFGIDIDVWGFVWLLAGIIQLVVAYLIYKGSRLGRGLGMGWAIVNVTLAAFSIFVAPFYSLLVVAVNMAIIRALTVDAQRRP